MRFTITGTWFCITIATLAVFVFGPLGFISCVLYFGILGTFSGSALSKRVSGMLAALGFVLLVAYPGLSFAPNAARRMSSTNDIAIASDAVHDYVVDHGALPWADDRESQFSWRVSVLPYVGMGRGKGDGGIFGPAPWDGRVVRAAYPL